MAAVALVALPVAGRPASSAPSPDESIIDGSALAASAVAVGAVDPNFDFWPVFSLSTMDNEASHGLSAGMWPGFLIDAFFWLYGFQSTERAALGISESQYPNPPHAAKASSSGFLLNNFSEGCRFMFGEGAAYDGCREVSDPIFRDPPGALSSSESRSGALSSDGSARATRFAYPALLEAADVVTSTDVRYTSEGTRTEATLVARDVVVGGAVRIETLRARSVAVASGSASTSDTVSQLELGRATYNGQPVVIDAGGVHLEADRSSNAVNDALAAHGLEVRLAQGRSEVTGGGEFADAATGGLVVRVGRERAEEAFPLAARDARDAACASAAQSPINEEITRVRVDQPNPLFGQVPFAPLPERVQAEQSVPPPFGCPFLNRSFEVALVLGVTNASSRLSPLPTLELAAGAGIDTIVGPSTTIRQFEVPGAAPTTGASADAVAVPRTGGRETVRLAATFGEDDVANGLKVAYAVLFLLGALAAAGRFFMRSVSAP